MNFSVALTTYQSERYLQVQLNSLLAQTKLPFELVVCDDGSTDSTLQLLENFSAAASFPVRIYRNEKNFGYAQNFAKAISLCKGDWIFLCDHDDRWRPEKLAYFAEKIAVNPEVIALFSDSALVNNQLIELGTSLFETNRFHEYEKDFIRRGEAWRTFLRHNVVAGHALGFRANLRDQILPVPPGWVHDAWIATMLSQLGKIDFFPERLVDYRQHEEQYIGVIEGSFWKRLRARVRRIGSRASLGKEALCWQALAAKREWQSPDKVQLALARKIKWLEGRAKMPAFPLFRLPFILLNLKNYFRFDNGWQTMAKDLLIR